jgi:hypothetical protein
MMNGEMMINGGKLKNLKKNPFQCHSIHLEYHYKSPGIESSFCVEKPHAAT